MGGKERREEGCNRRGGKGEEKVEEGGICVIGLRGMDAPPKNVRYVGV